MRCAVVGAGSWGTALALAASRAGCEVLLWGRNPAIVAGIGMQGCNPGYLPNIAFDAPIRGIGAFSDISGCDMVLLAVPAQTVREVSLRLADFIAPDVPLIVCAKGIEKGTGNLMSDILEQTCPHVRVGVLSGPSFALDVAEGKPTAVVLACSDIHRTKALCRALSSGMFRVEGSPDVRGLQYAGAVKNVFAISCGIAEGKACGPNARAQLMVRAFHEMMCLGAAYGALPETMMGLGGLGDLVLTCSAPRSRNMTFGISLVRNGAERTHAQTGKVLSEGVHTAETVAAVARAAGMDTPLLFATDDVIAGRCSIDEAFATIWSRPCIG